MTVATSATLISTRLVCHRRRGRSIVDACGVVAAGRRQRGDDSTKNNDWWLHFALRRHQRICLATDVQSMIEPTASVTHSSHRQRSDLFDVVLLHQPTHQSTLATSQVVADPPKMNRLELSTLVALLFVGFIVQTEAFLVPCPATTRTKTTVTTKLQSPLFAVPDDDDDDVSLDMSVGGGTPTRRQALSKTAGALVTSLLVTSTSLSSRPPLAQAVEGGSGNMGTSPDTPIVVLGGGGKVGKLCTQILADKGLFVRCTTRSGRRVLEDSTNSKYVSYVPCDVTNDASLQAALMGATGCVFAASASGKAKGGEPIDVDYVGAYKTAKACLAAKVPKLVVVSAGTVSRPDSAGFKATNFFVKYVYGDKVMDSKIAGESLIRDLYAQSGGPGLAYSIVRPGGLNDKASVGPNNVHVSQGDVYSSEISRQDVALVTVATLLKGPATDFTTFELNEVGKGLGKAMKTLPDLPTQLVHAGADSFEGLLDGLLTDKAMKAEYPDVISDFRGDGIPPIETLLSKYT